MLYRHVQWGYFAIPAIPLLGAGSALLVFGSDEVPVAFSMLILAILAIVAVLVVYFSRLEVAVDDHAVTAAFGAGRPCHTIALSDIHAVQRVRNKWWYGFGVRRTPAGWMYNVWGLDGVEIEGPEGRIFTIGTDDADGLASTIEAFRPR